MSIIFIISFCSLCPDDLSCGKSGMLMSPTINVLVSVCDLSFSNDFVGSVGALHLEHSYSELSQYHVGLFL